MIKEFKPILVFYVPDRTLLEGQIPAIKEYGEINGYDVLIWDKASTERLEIVSVYKETLITDIQKWIDEEIKKNK